MPPPMPKILPWVIVMPEIVAVTLEFTWKTRAALLPLTVRALPPVTPGPLIDSGTVVLDSVSWPMPSVMVWGMAKTPVVSNITRLGVLFGTSGLLLKLAHSMASRSVPTLDESPMPPMKFAVTMLSELASQAPISGAVPALAMLPGPLEAPRTAPRWSVVTWLLGSPLLMAGLPEPSAMVWVGPP